MAALWFLAGVVVTLSSIIVMLPWLRTVPGLAALPTLPWQAGAGALVAMATILGLCTWLRHTDPAVEPRVAAATTQSGAPADVTGRATDSWAEIANALGRGAAVPNNTTATPQSGAQPMSGAIASLQARLAKGGGSADDWELLAKSYEFLGRPADAAKARAQQLPATE